MKVASANSGGRIEFHLDSPTGTMLGYWTGVSTGGWQTWSIKNISLYAGTAVGTHTVYVTFGKLHCYTRTEIHILKSNYKKH